MRDTRNSHKSKPKSFKMITYYINELEHDIETGLIMYTRADHFMHHSIFQNWKKNVIWFLYKTNSRRRRYVVPKYIIFS